MKLPRLPGPVVRLLLLLLGLELLLPLAFALARNRFLFFPSPRPLPETALGSFGAATGRLVRVRRPDGRELAAYDISPPDLAPAAPVILYLHGNAGNIALRAALAGHLATGSGCRVLLPDYSGYGGNEGSPSEDEIGTDALAAYDHLVADAVAPARIVLYGESIGGGPALFVASRRTVGGVALQSTIASLSSMAWRIYPWLPLAALYLKGAFPNVARIGKLSVPVLVVHGTRDTIIPFAEGVALHAAAPAGAELLPIEGADHNDLFDVAGPAYLRGLGDRFRRWTAR